MTLDLDAALCAVLTALVRTGPHAVILIGGGGSLGKSTFAERLGNHLVETSGLTVSVLDLDCYLRPRVVRETDQGVISGYNPAAYDLNQAVADITSLLAGQAIRVSPYDKITSQKGLETSIGPGSVLIVEGVMALTEPIRQFGTVRVFFDAPTDVLYRNRLARELTLGFDRQRIERKFAILSEDYDPHIATQKGHAQIVVDVGIDYHFDAITLRDSV